MTISQDAIGGYAPAPARRNAPLSISEQLGNHRPGPKTYEFSSDYGGHEHRTGTVMVGHAVAGAGPRGLSHIEFGPPPPEGCQYALGCPDCPARVDMLPSPPGCLSEVYVVLHEASCPGLRAARRRTAR